MSRKITQKELDQGLVDDLVLQSEKGAPNGVPSLDSSSKIPISQIPLLGGANIGSSAITNAKMSRDVKVGSLAALNTTAKTDVTSAINEVSNRTGSLASLNTTAKDNLVNAVNELFTFADNGKEKIRTAIIGKDPNVSIPPSPSFDELVTGIAAISGGKKIATGLKNGTYREFLVTGLDFTPRLLILQNSKPFPGTPSGLSVVSTDTTFKENVCLRPELPRIDLTITSVAFGSIKITSSSDNSNFNQKHYYLAVE